MIGYKLEFFSEYFYLSIRFYRAFKLTSLNNFQYINLLINFQISFLIILSLQWILRILVLNSRNLL